MFFVKIIFLRQFFLVEQVLCSSVLDRRCLGARIIAIVIATVDFIVLLCLLIS